MNKEKTEKKPIPRKKVFGQKQRKDFIAREENSSWRNFNRTDAKREAWTPEQRKEYLAKTQIFVHLSDLENGHEEMEGVRSIRIKSKEYTLLIMEGFMPVLGKIEGDVTFLHDSGDKSLQNVIAFFCYRDNHFWLMVEEE